MVEQPSKIQSMWWHHYQLDPIQDSHKLNQVITINTPSSIFLLFSVFLMVLHLYEPNAESFANCSLTTAPESVDKFPMDCYKSPTWMSRQCWSDCNVALVLGRAVSSVAITTASNASATMRPSLKQSPDILSFAWWYCQLRGQTR